MSARGNNPKPHYNRGYSEAFLLKGGLDYGAQSYETNIDLTKSDSYLILSIVTTAYISEFYTLDDKLFKDIL